jgi:hypothetical protein
VVRHHYSSAKAERSTLALGFMGAAGSGKNAAKLWSTLRMRQRGIEVKN